MLKKNKKFTLLLSGLSGVLLTSSIAGVALTSCTTASTSSSDVQYSYVIDWNNKDAVDRLIIDDSGLVYSDNAKTTIIAISPKVKLTTVKIPSRVKSIMGYSKVMYQNNNDQTIVDQIPSGGSESDYTKVYQSYGAFQDMTSLETVVLESGSQLKSIGGLAFSGCTTLKTISGLSSSLDYIGTSAFNNCINLTSIDTTNVVKVGDAAFTNCTSLTTVDLSSAIYIGNYAFQNCTGLTSIGSLDQVRTLGISTFQSAFASGSSITLKLTNLTYVPTSAFQAAKGITKVDFSGNTLLTYLDTAAFMGSSVTEVDFTGCSKLTTITERSFKDCTNLTTVYLPADSITSLTTIGSNTFLNCTSLTTVGVSGTSKGSFVATSKLSTVGANFLSYTAITSLNLSNFAISSSNSSSNPFGSQFSLSFISNLASVTLPSTITTLNAGLFYGSGTSSTSGFSLTLPSSITDLVYSSTSLSFTGPNDTTTTTVENPTPFTGSGIGAIDMSNITSYQSTSGSENVIPPYLFNGATKLTSVVLKSGTTEIGNYAFQGTTALTSITYPSSSDTATTADTNGFTASADLTSIGTGAFYSAFSEDSGATVDLSAMTFTATPAAFSSSNIANLVLPTTTITIPANSFDSMTKLTTVNFSSLTNLTTIYKANFNNTLLTSIDLSTTKFNTISGDTGSLFTGLPTSCVVSLPSTTGNFSGVFTDTNGDYVTFSYPNGISQDLFTISSGVLTFNSSKNTTLITNANVLNLSNLTTATTIGTSTFFGNQKLTSLTLPASVVTFAAGTSITANTANTAETGEYKTANIPFGNNSFTKLNYTGFETSSSATAADTTAQSTLFSTTTANTWSSVANIINSLSYQAHPTSTTTAAALKANMSTWTDTTGGANVTNSNAVSTFVSGTSVQFSNSYESTSDTSTTGRTISSTDTSVTIVHNGVTWTYTNDGTTIKLTGSVNMYKASDTTNSKYYLTFFNETTYTATGETTVYYVPSATPITVTLTIATASSSATK